MGEANPLIHLSQNVQMVLCEMTSKRAGAVSVIDEEGRLLGLITDFDIRRVLESGEALFSLTIEDVMNPKPSWVYQDEKAVNALEFMEKREKPISVLPVLDRQEKVVGILHLHDLVSCGI
jgi:arabinose-5-phosphate isomerase